MNDDKATRDQAVNSVLFSLEYVGALRSYPSFWFSSSTNTLPE